MSRWLNTVANIVKNVRNITTRSFVDKAVTTITNNTNNRKNKHFHSSHKGKKSHDKSHDNSHKKRKYSDEDTDAEDSCDDLGNPGNPGNPSNQIIEDLNKKHYKKECIPKRVRELVWTTYKGEIFDSKCHVKWCDNIINVFNFQVGHDIPESKGGTLDISNLKPICGNCNHSMGNKYTIGEWNKLVVKYK